MLDIVVVIPTFGRSDLLDRCIAALETAGMTDIIVVDDASPDSSVAEVAGRRNTRLIQLPVNAGPAGARTAGAAAAGAADILYFVDSDVLVAPDVRAHLDAAFADPAIAAVFGCYDDAPAETDLMSLYVNLRHREIHRLSAGPADTFWAGCGAVRRVAFEAVGGFDPSRRWNFIEDVELGRRLDRAGYAIRLDARLQGKHLKRWTWATSARTDAMLRARPWVRLMLEETRVMRGLNADRGGRASILAVAAIPPCLAAAFVWPPALLLAALGLLAIPLLNRRLFARFAQLRGLGFAACCVPLHAFHLGCVAVGLGVGLLDHLHPARGRNA
jgi:GT2 family glycosyltransferase